MPSYGESLRRVTELRAQARNLSLQATRLLQIADELMFDAGEGSDNSEIEASLTETLRMKPRLEHEHELLLAGLAEQLYRQRKRREQHFDADFFGEPAWDMLLDLFIARVRGRRISVTSACAASNKSQTTALRWLDVLIDTGLVERKDSEFDRRTAFVALTERGAARMRDFLLEKESRPSIGESGVRATAC